MMSTSGLTENAPAIDAKVANGVKTKEIMRFTIEEGDYENDSAYLLMLNNTICKVYIKKYYKRSNAIQLAKAYIWEYEKMGIQVYYPEETSVITRT